jgi:GT2 family glycosyltransferase
MLAESGAQRADPGASALLADVGVVAIGRNEGDRLKACLAAARRDVSAVIYVDSGSTDGSREWAREQGVEVIELDMAAPFTAARARNAGWRRLTEIVPDAAFVQVVDGDCELVEGCMADARRAFDTDDRLAVACGQRRERYPDRTRYNRLCSLEWEAPAGLSAACGGDAMFRLDALREAGGFDPALIAGEEPELCFRLRQRGWKILRLDRDMTLHDADMTRLGQWWKRARRAGHAAAEGAWMHGRSPERYNVRRTGTILLWALLLPLAIAASAWPTGGWSLLGLGLYPLQWGRITRKERRRGRAPADARLVATFTILGKLPQLAGVVSFVWDRLRGRRAQLIEYK